MTNLLHDAAMAAKRFHDAALAYLDRPDDMQAYARVRSAELAMLSAHRKYSAQMAVEAAKIKFPKTWEGLGPE